MGKKDMAVEDRRQLPLDDFERDEAHQGFRLALEKMGKLSPRLDDSPETSVPVNRSFPVPTSSVKAGLPKILVFERNVSVRMGQLSLSYDVDTPQEVVVASDDSPQRVIDAITTLHKSTIRSRDDGLPAVQRRMASFVRAEATAALLECGRLDLIQLSRILYDRGLPGVPGRPR